MEKKIAVATQPTRFEDTTKLNFSSHPPHLSVNVMEGIIMCWHAQYG